MILFKKDLIYSKGIIDYNTSNRSFIKMAFVLKKLNIKNNDFFLYLRQPELSGIDPHSKNLDLDTKMKIGLECKINPWYYFREVIRIPGTGIVNGMPFKLDRANLSTLWVNFNHIDVILIAPRQLGKTIAATGLISYIMFIHGENLKILMLTKDDDLRVDNVKRLRDVRDSLPTYLIDKVSYKKSQDNTEKIEYKPLSNLYSSLVAQTNKIAAEKKGRGATVAVAHIDEVPYCSLIHITYPSMISSMNAAIENAEKYNQLHGIILTSTMGRLDTEEGIYTDRLISKSFRFFESLYDLDNNEELKRIVKKNSQHKMICCEFNHRQLGKTDEWLKETIHRLNIVDNDVIKRDYLNIPTYGTASSPIPQNLLIKIKNSIKEPKYIQYINDYEIRWYLDKHIIKSDLFKKIPIIMGMDGSENIGEDYTSLVFLRATDGEVIGMMRCNESNIIALALFIANILIENPNILYIPERNSTGVTIIDSILIEFEKRNINPLTRIFNTIIQNEKEENIIHKLNNVDLSGKDRKYLGFRTTGSKATGRSFLLKTVLLKALNLLHSKLNDATLINEISKLYKKNGKIYHLNTEHDDVMFGYIMASYLLFFGKNLKFYDFLKNTNSKILSNIKDNEDSDYISNDILKKKKKLMKLKEEYKNNESEFLKMRLKLKIKELEKEIPKKDLIDIDKEKAISVTHQMKKEKKKYNIVNKINSYFL